MILEVTLEKCWIQGSSRGILYSFLSAAFKDEMNDRQIKEFLNKDNIASLKHSLALLPEETAAPLLSCLDELAASWRNGSLGNETETEAEILELRKEFAYLFLTPHGVYPFESMYRGKRKHLMDTPWEKVRGFYRSIGLEKDKHETHPEDHIAVELGLMAGLAFLSGRVLPENEVGDLSEDDQRFALEAQEDFLKEHLLEWIPRFCNDVVEKTRHPFYRSVAVLTGLVIEADGLMLHALRHDSSELNLL